MISGSLAPAIEYRALNVADPREEEMLRDILVESFAFPVARWKPFLDLLGPANFRVVTCDHRIVAGMAIHRMGQWFGGRNVPMVGVAAVGVAPESRAGGFARILMTRCLEEMRGEGIPLSTLFASTQHLYRGVGYEQAGTRTRHTMFLPSLPPLRRMEGMLPMAAVATEDPLPFEAIYRAHAATWNGMIDRTPCMWKRILWKPEGTTLHAYRISGEPGRDEAGGDRWNSGSEQGLGYIIYTLSPLESGFDIRIRDWVALSPEAHARLLRFLTDHRSLGHEVSWYGPPVDPFRCIPDEQQERQPMQMERWMLRVIDVAKALEARGYPSECEATLHLAIEDDVIDANRDRFILRVAGGKGVVTRGGDGLLRAHIRGLSPLYTGMLSPFDLARIGFVDAGPAVLADAARVFGGPSPWMSDSF
jgi:predicted acetyltransferase